MKYVLKWVLTRSKKIIITSCRNLCIVHLIILDMYGEIWREPGFGFAFYLGVFFCVLKWQTKTKPNRLDMRRWITMIVCKISDRMSAWMVVCCQICWAIPNCGVVISHTVKLNYYYYHYHYYHYHPVCCFTLISRKSHVWIFVTKC